MDQILSMLKRSIDLDPDNPATLIAYHRALAKAGQTAGSYVKPDREGIVVGLSYVRTKKPEPSYHPFSYRSSANDNKVENQGRGIYVNTVGYVKAENHSYQLRSNYSISILKVSIFSIQPGKFHIHRSSCSSSLEISFNPGLIEFSGDEYNPLYKTEYSLHLDISFKNENHSIIPGLSEWDSFGEVE